MISHFMAGLFPGGCKAGELLLNWRVFVMECVLRGALPSWQHFTVVGVVDFFSDGRAGLWISIGVEAVQEVFLCLKKRL